MTNEEAILTIDTMAMFSSNLLNDKIKQDIEEARKMAIEALEKQVQKKPKTERKTVDLGNGYSVKIVEIHRCPVCGDTVLKGHRCYGLDCGQKIDWSDYDG